MNKKSKTKLLTRLTNKSKKNLNRVFNKKKKSIKKGGMINDPFEISLSQEDQDNIQILQEFRNSLNFSKPFNNEITDEGIKFNYIFAKQSGYKDPSTVVSNILYIELLVRESIQLELSYRKPFFET